MPDLETTQAKLLSTPTAGVSGEHSAYYRRLLSAGYKGYVQGMVGGGTLYGTIGMGIGAAVGIPLAFATAGMSLWLIPAMGTMMGAYGAHAFADIGKTAAIYADGAETNEKRRYLLDRYYETPNDEEAREIKRQLEEDNKSHAPDKAFHWRPAVIGAALGITVMLVTIAIAPYFAPHVLEGVLAFLHVPGVAEAGLQGLSTLAAPLAVTAAAAIGGLTGAVIGVDRSYIRRWMDKAEVVVHDSDNQEKQLAERERNVKRLMEASQRDPQPMRPTPDASNAQPISVKSISAVPAELDRKNNNAELAAREAPLSPRAIAGLDAPDTIITDAQKAERMIQHQAMLG